MKLTENVVALIMPVRVRTVGRAAWQNQMVAIQFLNSMPKHWSISFKLYILAHMHLAVRIDADDMLVIRGMMNFTERQAVGYNRTSPSITVGNDMCGIE